MVDVKYNSGDKMNHEIDLNKYDVRTDLALDLLPNNKGEKIDDIIITDIIVDDEISRKINKKKGRYITIEFRDVTDYNNKEKLKKIFSKILKKMIKKNHILIIGLGNDKVTPDSLGPEAIDHIIVTNHMYELNALENGFKRVSAIKPGVMGETGIETIDIIKGVISYLKPDELIVIDSLASSSLERLNKTIQITDTGINPGSGVGNNRKEISYDTLGIPVLAIGVPTVLDAPTIVSDTIDFMIKKFTYTKNNMNNPVDKLVINKNYLNKDIKVDENDKKELLGLVGNLEKDETKELVYEVLNPIGYNLMVTPKEIDYLIKNLSDIIGNGINRALHKKVKDI